MSATTLALVLLGGVVAMDGVTVGQFMISRPLVAGLLAGWVAGDPVAGGAVGAVLEVYLLVAVPTGGARFPEPGPATVVGAAVAAVIGGSEGLALGVAGGLVWGQVCSMSQSLQRRVTARIVPVPGEDPISARGVIHAHLMSVGLDGLRGCVMTAAGLALGALLAPHLAPGWPLGVPETRALLLLGGFVSLGILVRGETPKPRRLLLFGLGLGAGLLAGVVLR